MRYFVDIFSVETYQYYSATDKSLVGFSLANKAIVSKLQPGDRLVCYLKGLGAFFAVLEITGPLEDRTGSEPTDYPIVVPTKPLVWLEPGYLLPIRRNDVWGQLALTKHIPLGAGGWSATLRRSGTSMKTEDGELLHKLLMDQVRTQTPDGFTSDGWKKNALSPTQGEPEVTLPTSCPSLEPVTRTSHKMQALIAVVGAAMGFQVWLPANDRKAVEACMTAGQDKLLDCLPPALFSDPVAIKTIEQIDVLWLQKNSVKRAFEVEHTTAVYSGILRMADLLALQPNFHTSLHLVAPAGRRSKVFHELRRPAFSMYSQGAMHDLCTYIAYERIAELAANPFLSSMKDDAVDTIAEKAKA